MKITSATRTFAQDGNSYILTNDQSVTFGNVEDLTPRGCIVNLDEKKISPELPIAALGRHSPYWTVPDRQIKPEELKDFYQCK
jgi:hypothetical protein